MNDAEMNKILIELGSENLTMVRLSDGAEFSPSKVDKIVELLSKLEALSKGVTRYGCDFIKYVNSANESGKLPAYVARIRTGNKEDFRFLYDDEERSKFFVEFDNAEDIFSVATIREVRDENGVMVQQRIGVYEIYEALQIEKVLAELAKLGLERDSYAPSAKPRFKLMEKGSDGKVVSEAEIFNALEMVAKIRELGRRGMSISRYKGLGEMESEQLYDTTMDPEKRTLLKVSIEDAAAAESTFSMLMGEDVPIRRAFIEDNALNTSYLDI